MKKIALFVIGLMALFSCQKQQEAGYIVQVSRGGWHSPDYTAEQVIGRIDTVSRLIPVKKVIIGWSLDKEIYRRVGEYLHDRDISMLLWLPVFAETEEVCENSPAVDLWGKVPSDYDQAAGDGFRFNCPSDPQNAANLLAVFNQFLSAIFVVFLQKSNLNRKIYIFRLFPTEWMFPRSALLLCQAKNVLCFHHEWGLSPKLCNR